MNLGNAESAIVTLAVTIITLLMAWMTHTVHNISGDVKVVVHQLQQHDERIDRLEVSRFGGP